MRQELFAGVLTDSRKIKNPGFGDRDFCLSDYFGLMNTNCIGISVRIRFHGAAASYSSQCQ